jgi:hypothetical protein
LSAIGPSACSASQALIAAAISSGESSWIIRHPVEFVVARSMSDADPLPHAQDVSHALAIDYNRLFVEFFR